MAGKITHVDIQFPSGVNALAHIAIAGGLHQAFPTNPDGNFASGNETISWDEDFDLLTGPLSLDAYTWNDDTTYDHTITVRVVMTAASLMANVSSQIKALLAGG